MDNQDLWHLELAVPQAQAGPFTELFEAVCDTVLVQGLDEDPIWTVQGWVTGAPDQAAVTATVALTANGLGIEQPDLIIAPQEQRDWVAENLASFHPITAGRFHVHCSHHKDSVPPNCLPLQVDASVAFGTGQHASTRGCLIALDRMGRKPPRRVLDMGCGSGILAMAAARLWNVSVLAADIDPRSVAVTNLNADLNDLRTRITALLSEGYRHPMVSGRGPYDLILANILARPLMGMAGDLARVLRPGGRVVLAGFLKQDSNRVLAAHRARGLHLIDRVPVDDWETLVLGSPP
ncbi:50S ribosomal protein L11 methyltransferase [Magnetospira sp. QH-2]|uniref:50S ribosomal protein L11 methyltransferase n=1 Tax=Magnetospira sp. (strain QH-2) TaxID=1288970 RepID=UPI0005FA651E|nr:50S ribosomal protein L11 methyltransferase [Magnetospira sp. QH-2]